MEEVNINEIAKAMTRKEFLDCTDTDGWLISPKEFNIEPLNCPNTFNLKAFYIAGKCGNNPLICKECWKEAIKDIKFKDDLEQIQQSKNTNIKEESKLYYGDEILKMIRESKIKKGQEFYIYCKNVKVEDETVKWNGSDLLDNDNENLEIQDILEFQFQPIGKEYYNLEKAMNIAQIKNKKLKHKNWESYILKQDMIDIIVYSIKSNRINIEDLIRPVWEVED